MSKVQEYRQVLSQFEQDVEAAVEEAYRAEGYVDEHDALSESAMKDAAFKAAMGNCVVSSKAERSRKALTKGGYYSLVFPSGPGAGEAAADLDPVSVRVVEKLKSIAWGLTQTRRSGFLQLCLEREESTLVVCRCKVLRYGDSSQAFYVTDNEDMIMEDAVDKEIQSLVRRASSLRRDLSMIVERHPKLQGPVAEQLGVELGRMNRELTIGTSDNGSRKTLNSGRKA